MVTVHLRASMFDLGQLENGYNDIVATFNGTIAQASVLNQYGDSYAS
jgi:hypothetical protein